METIQTPEKNISQERSPISETITKAKGEVNMLLRMPNRNLDYKSVSEKLVTELKAYVSSAKQKGFVVGVSGGIDSALVSTLCALTGEKVIVMDMPIHQKSDEVDRANDHMNWLQNNFPNVERYSIDLTETFETFKKALPEIDDEVTRYMAYINTRSRLRAVTLYAIGNEHSCLVAGTGNKVEDYGIGFFTKYGDGAVDISPIGNLYKSEVYEMAASLGVNEAILKARPTDGLHPNGATDEDQIGCSYDELEWAMYKHSEFIGIVTSNLLMWNDERATKSFLESFSGREREVMEIYLSRHFANGHKMEMPKVFEI